MARPVLLIDKRELRARGKSKKLALPIEVPSGWEHRLVTLPTGDYTVQGLHGYVVVERKSLHDLYSTLTYGKTKLRFMRQLERMRAFKKSFVMVEGGPFEVESYDGRHKGRASGFNVVRFLYELSAQYGFEVAFGDAHDPALNGRLLVNMLRPYVDMAKAGKIRPRSVKYNT